MIVSDKNLRFGDLQYIGIITDIGNRCLFVRVDPVKLWIPHRINTMLINISIICHD
jgi:hypothetical protein